MPDAASDDDPAKRAKLMRRMLAEWNDGLDELDAALAHPDRDRELVHYGEDLTDGDLAPIPEEDLPAGLPRWMSSLTPWADRVGADRETKRATLVVTVPPDERPWNPT
jgi:hypothetical protein